MTRTLLILNTGSSSIKFRLYGMSADLPFLLGGKVTDIGGSAEFRLQVAEDTRGERMALPAGSTHASALRHVLDWLMAEPRAGTLVGAVHRIVHGGARYTDPVRLDRDALAYLHGLGVLAPLHQPHNLRAVEALWDMYPQLPQYGCFDTAFHATQPEIATSFALPRALREQGVRRYGFHGLSYAWIAYVLQRDHPALAQGRVVAAHLGNGASLCAMLRGRSVDTTMGMTALDGLPMGTRCGALDAGVIIHLQRTLGMDVDAIERLLYDESGLKGLSGISNDVKTLSEDGSADAQFALDYFVRKCTQYIAAMAASMGGIDGLVFSGGIGENAEPIRRRILDGLAFLPPFESLVIPANEERGMALSIYDHFAQEMLA